MLHPHERSRPVLAIEHQPFDRPFALDVAREALRHARPGQLSSVRHLEIGLLLPCSDLERTRCFSRHGAPPCDLEERDCVSCSYILVSACLLLPTGRLRRLAWTCGETRVEHAGFAADQQGKCCVSTPINIPGVDSGSYLMRD